MSQRLRDFSPVSFLGHKCDAFRVRDPCPIFAMPAPFQSLADGARALRLSSSEQRSARGLWKDLCKGVGSDVALAVALSAEGGAATGKDYQFQSISECLDHFHKVQFPFHFSTCVGGAAFSVEAEEPLPSETETHNLILSGECLEELQNKKVVRPGWKTVKLNLGTGRITYTDRDPDTKERIPKTYENDMGPIDVSFLLYQFIQVVAKRTPGLKRCPQTQEASTKPAVSGTGGVRNPGRKRDIVASDSGQAKPAKRRRKADQSKRDADPFPLSRPKSERPKNAPQVGSLSRPASSRFPNFDYAIPHDTNMLNYLKGKISKKPLEGGLKPLEGGLPRERTWETVKRECWYEEEVCYSDLARMIRMLPIIISRLQPRPL